MKTRIFSLLLVLPLLLCIFASCGEGTKTDVTIDITALSTDLAKVSFVDEMVALSAEAISARYGFAASASSVIVYGGSGATPEEIIVAEYASEADAKSAMAGFEEHLEAQKTTFDDYNAEYRPLLNDTVLEQIGKYIVYCVCDAPADAKTVVNNHKTAAN